jgi:DNA-binding FadR family transcriptional regulator
MPLEAVKNTSLADQVFDQLAAEIVSGGYPPGQTLEAERSLAAVFGVNRHVIREAIGRLEQIGLVRVAQGSGTTVLDFRTTAGLDMLAVLAARPAAFEGLLGLTRSALEMRSGNGADVARLCAERANPDLRRQLVQTAEQLAEMREGRSLLAADQRFWQLMLEGADNLAYQLAFNSLIKVVQGVPELSLAWLEQELHHGDYRRPIAVAIAAGDAEAAARAARADLDFALELLSGVPEFNPAAHEASR